jgi:PST family polysaccharide transporter
MYVMGGETLGAINRYIGPWLIGSFLGNQALAWFDIGMKLLNMMTNLFTGIVFAVALPTFARLQHNIPQLRSAFLAAVRMTSLLAFPASIGASVLSYEFIVSVLSKEEWLPAVPLMQILSLAAMFQALTHFNAPIMMACGKASKAFKYSLLATALNVAGFAISLPFGIVAVAAVFVLRIAFLTPLIGASSCHLIGLSLREYLGQLASPLIASLLMAGAVIAVKHLLTPHLGPIALLAILVPFGAVAYAVVYMFLDKNRLLQSFAYVQAGLRTTKDPINT